MTGECPSGNVFVDEVRGELVCVDTGEVVGTVVDLGREWRVFDEEGGSTRARAGPPLDESVHDRGLATSVGRARGLPGATRLERMNARLRIHGKRRFVRALQMIREEARRMGIPFNVVQTAAQLLRPVALRGYGRGDMLRHYVLASLYLSCRAHGVPRSFSDFVRHAINYERIGVKEQVFTVRKLRYACRRIVEVQRERSRASLVLSVRRPGDYVSYVANVLGLSPASQALMYRICKAVEALNLANGKSPLSVVAAVAYIASGVVGEKRRQKDIADALATITDVAIRNRYREIIDRLYVEVTL